MIVPTHQCPKCGSEMERGFASALAVDGGIARGIWVKGDDFEHINSFFGGTVINETRPIHTYRCIRCGFLESYASSSSTQEGSQE